ncbi:MAG TPA: phage/plasmid primase, P4 family [Bacilli bacterium]|nr:phage/plasmid primase, P4 family [Bacilli bacterium]
MSDEVERLVKEDEKKKEIVFTPLVLLTMGKTKDATELIAKEIQKKYVIYTTRDDERSECWIYEEGIFKPEGKTYIEEYMRQELKEYYEPSIINKVLVKIKADTYIEQDEFFGRQNKYPNMIPVQNGVLNIDTRELSPHSPQYCFFNKLPVTYNSDANCFNIQKFLEEVLPDQESIDTLQEFYGSCLLKEYRYEKSLLVTGNGSNGKGKTLELLKHLLGIDNITEISPQTLEENNFAMAELVNKLANISADINSKALQNTGVFKSLTGRDLMTSDRKFKTRVKFTNYAKMIFSANEVPVTYDLSDGFFRRWLIIDFPYRFLDPEDIEEVPIEEQANVKLKDPEKISKLIDPVELSGFLNWALEGYSRLKLNKRFSNSQTITKVRQMWLRKSSSIQAFLTDWIIEDTESLITKQEFKEKYIAYCKKHKINIVSDKMIHNVITKYYAVVEYRPFNNGEERDRCWKGIKFKDLTSY